MTNQSTVTAAVGTFIQEDLNFCKQRSEICHTDINPQSFESKRADRWLVCQSIILWTLVLQPY